MTTSSSVDALKQEGNKAFSSGDYQKAIDFFTKAIEQDSSNHVLFSNRSAAYASLKDYKHALEDAEKAVYIAPDWVKGYSRKGAALFGLNRLKEAEEAYTKGLEVEPNNAALKKGLEEIQAAVSSSANPFGAIFQGDVAAKLAANPSTAHLVADAQFMSILRQVQSNPQLMTQYFQDPRMMQALGALLGVDLQTVNVPPEAEPTEVAKEHFKEEEEEKKEEEPMEVEVENVSEEEKEQKRKKEDAKKEKEKGNEHYKKKEFEEALQCYAKAWELDQNDITILTNRAAVFFEQGKFDECVKICEEAIDRGREIRADFKLIAKAYARMGNSYMKMDNLELAIKFYEKSLAENRTADVLTKLREAEKLKREIERQAYLDPAKAEEARAMGNELFKDGKYAEAIQSYNEAIKRNDTDPKSYSNRAACYSKLMALPEALKDAEKAISLDKTFVKAYIRKANIQFSMRDHVECIKTCEQALDLPDLDPKLKQELEQQKLRAQSAMYGYDENLPQEERAKRAMQDPKIQEILADPIMQQILQQMSADPAAAQDHMRNPDIRAKIQKLIAAGVIGVR